MKLTGKLTTSKMKAISVILSGLFLHGGITGSSLFLLNSHFTFINFSGIFNGQFLFILKFLGEVLLVFFIGGAIGKLLHLDKADDKSDSNIFS
jgi:hypothetical protein